MIQRIYRTVFLLFLIAGSIRVFAQASRSNVGLWLVDSELSESMLAESDEGDVVADFEESVGFGVSYNHFWTDLVSTEFMLSKFSADMTISEPATTGGRITSEAGELDVQLLTAIAQLHFHRNGRFSPYIGGGAAWISGDFDPTDELGEDSIDLESELTWTAAAGVNIRLTDSFAIGGEIKYVPWSAVEDDADDDDDPIDVDPITFSAGLKFQF